MKAIVYSAPETFSLQDIPEPIAKDGEVLIAVEKVGVCGTDMHVHHGTIPVRYPLVPGHEIIGTVQEVGPAVDSALIGTRVVVNPNVPCGVCSECQRTPSMQCRDLLSFGVNANGGLAEYLACPVSKVTPVGGLIPEIGVFSEPLACILAGVERAGIGAGDDVLVLGAGPSGLLFSKMAQLRGAARVTVAAPAGRKLETSALFGADRVVALQRDDIAASVRQLLATTDRRGFDLVVDVTGSAEVSAWTPELAAPGARIVLYGVTQPADAISIHPYDIYKRDLTIIGSFAQTNQLHAAAALLNSGRVDPRPLVTHEFDLADWATAVDTLLHDRSAHKAIITVR